MSELLINGNALSIPLADQSVQCVVTSPPYYGLRDYGTATWEGGDPECDHKIDNSKGIATSTLDGSKRNVSNALAGYKNVCAKCGAIRVDNQIGLEPTPEAYVENMVAVFRELWRVLRDDGVLWLNLGDSYSSGIGANILDLLADRIKEGVILDGARCSLTITAKSDSVLENNELPPETVFTQLFGIQRILVKERDDHFCQVLNGFAPISDCWISSSVISVIDKPNSQVFLYPQDGIRIIISDHHLNTNSAFRVPIVSLATKDSQTSFSVKETGEPIAESVINVQPVGDAISLNALSKSVSEIDSVNKAVALCNTLVPNSQRLGNFSITKASAEHLALSLMDDRIEIAFSSVTHLFTSNKYGSLIRYTELYHQAQQMVNERQAKQEIGIPEMVKRALMRDGWICRSTIIWHKPNPMPESVTDRPTKAHEYIFLLTKNARYYYDHEAIKEDANPEHFGRYKYDFWPNGTKEANGGGRPNRSHNTGGSKDPSGKRNKRSVWTVTTKPYRGAHFATYPPDLIEPCIKAGSKEGDVVFDPFAGSGTTLIVARKLKRHAIGLDLSMDYLTKNARERLGYNALDRWIGKRITKDYT